MIDGLAPGIASLKTTRSEAEARPHCKLARISPADRLDPHLNFVTPISPVCANSLCQILRAFPVKLHWLYCTHDALLYTQAPACEVGGFLFFAPCSGVWGGWALTTLDARTKNKVPKPWRYFFVLKRTEFRLDAKSACGIRGCQTDNRRSMLLVSSSPTASGQGVRLASPDRSRRIYPKIERIASR